MPYEQVLFNAFAFQTIKQIYSHD